MKYLLFGFLVFNLAIAQEARLVSVTGENVKVLVGEVFDAKLEIWPRDTVNIDSFSEILNKEISGLFYVNSIENIQLSSNNPDVVEIDMQLVLTRPVGNIGVHLLEIGEKSISFTTKNFEFDNQKIEAKELIIQEQELNKGIDNNIIIASIIIFLIILILIAYFFKIKGKVKSKDSDTKNWSEIFNNANEIDDFIEIYKHKSIWLEGIPKTQDIVYFFKTLNKYQYKPSVENSEIEEIRDAFGPIRNIFDGRS